MFRPHACFRERPSDALNFGYMLDRVELAHVRGIDVGEAEFVEPLAA